MRKELLNAFEEWKNKSLGEVRDIKYFALPNNREYYVAVSIAVDLTLIRRSETIYEYSLMQTMAQSEGSTLNASGDVYKFNKIANMVENNFLARCSKAIEDDLRDIEPGFL